jgi:hypothetical protein
MHPIVVLLLLGLAFGLFTLSKDLRGPGKEKAIRLLVGGLVTGASILLALRVQQFWIAILGLAWLLVQKRVLAGLGSGKTNGQGTRLPPDAAVSATRMSREEALSVLGLADGVSREEILAAYRELITRMHPDRGGSSYLAAKINQAKDVLIR